MTTSISNHFDLSNESVERILSENGFKEMGLSVNALGYKKTGYGHWLLSCEIADQNDWTNSIVLSRTTTNSNLIDDWGEDEVYFQSENSGKWYESNSDVMNCAFDFIISNESNQEQLRKFLNQEYE